MFTSKSDASPCQSLDSSGKSNWTSHLCSCPVMPLLSVLLTKKTWPFSSNQNRTYRRLLRDFYSSKPIDFNEQKVIFRTQLLPSARKTSSGLHHTYFRDSTNLYHHQNLLRDSEFFPPTKSAFSKINVYFGTSHRTEEQINSPRHTSTIWATEHEQKPPYLSDLYSESRVSSETWQFFCERTPPHPKQIFLVHCVNTQPYWPF